MKKSRQRWLDSMENQELKKEIITEMKKMISQHYPREKMMEQVFDSWQSFITSAFSWKDSEKGGDYWVGISKLTAKQR